MNRNGANAMTAQPTRDHVSTQDGLTSAEEGLTPEELAAEGITPLPDKEVASILDLNADLDLGIDLSAPIDLAVGANANVAAAIDAAVGANVLSAGSTAQALSDQGTMITQGIVGDATATSTQVSGIDQTGDAAGTEPAPGTGAVTPGDAVGAVDGTVGDAVGAVGDTVSGIDTSGALSGDVLNVNVDLNADANVTAPIAGAVAANANVAAPIDAAAAANIASVASSATAVANQDAIIEQSIEGDATADANQDSEISQ
jgi:hypothetical protein